MIPSQAKKKIQNIRRRTSYIDSERKKSKPMTIAAGFCCPDGVVLCADSQFTVPDSMKLPTPKFGWGTN